MLYIAYIFVLLNVIKPNKIYYAQSTYVGCSTPSTVRYIFAILLKLIDVIGPFHFNTFV